MHGVWYSMQTYLYNALHSTRLLNTPQVCLTSGSEAAEFHPPHWYARELLGSYR